MTIYWVNTDGTSARDAIAAVERALAENDYGTAPAAALPESERADPYLDDNLGYLHANWPVDQVAVIMSNRPRLARGIIAFQRAIRAATWWYAHPQWQQVSGFHAALVRVIDVLLDRQRLLSVRIADLERTHVPAHVYALEQQLQALRSEQRELRQRIAFLEGQLHAGRRSADESSQP